MSLTCLIPVRCPHCRTPFAIDPNLETAAVSPGPGGPGEDAPVAFRPVCPSCRQRVMVRVGEPPADTPPDVRRIL
jgi:hypothetical protein